MDNGLCTYKVSHNISALPHIHIRFVETEKCGQDIENKWVMIREYGGSEDKLIQKQRGWRR